MVAVPGTHERGGQGVSTRDALRAVLSLHRPAEHHTIAEVDRDGSVTELAIDGPAGVIATVPPDIRCSCTPQGFLPWPCPTVLAIDGALGVPADRIDLDPPTEEPA